MPAFEDQQLLMRALAILETYCYVSAAAKPSNKAERSPNDNALLRLLDTIATALATGKPGDVAAAAFVEGAERSSSGDKKKFSVLLAKNNAPTNQDKRAATKFFNLINDSETDYGRDLFPFLLEQCQANMKKRVTSLLKIMDTTGFKVFMQSQLNKSQQVAGGGRFVASEEFPLCPEADVVKDAMERHNSNFKAVWNDLIGLIETNGHGFLEENEEAKQYTQYTTLSAAAYAIGTSMFLGSLPGGYNDWAQTFKRRLAKIHIYTRGIRFLHQEAGKMGPFKYSWVGGEIPGGTNATYGPFISEFRKEINMPLRRIQKADVSQKTLPFQPLPTKLNSPVLQDRWRKLTTKNGVSQKFEARLHCELRIVCFMDQLGPSARERTPNEAADELPHFLIGVSKRCCLMHMCQWTLNQRNACNYGRIYMTSGDHGKAYTRWLDPRTDYTAGVLSEVDRHIRAAINEGPRMRTASDETYSSSGEDRRARDSGDGTRQSMNG